MAKTKVTMPIMPAVERGLSSVMVSDECWKMGDLRSRIEYMRSCHCTPCVSVALRDLLHIR